MAASERFARAIAAIDAGNAHDPNVVTVRGRTGPKEILHAELVTEWVAQLRPDASEPLLLAARGHHFRRWTVPRASAPAGSRRLSALAQVAAGATRARARRAARRRRATTPTPSPGCRRSCARTGSRARPTRCRRSKTRSASCSSRPSSPTSRPASTRPRSHGVIVRTAQKMSDAGSRRDRRRCRSTPVRARCSTTALAPRRRGALPRRAGRARLGRGGRDARARHRAHGPVPRRLPRARAVRRVPRRDDRRARRLPARRRPGARRRARGRPWSCARPSTTATPASRRARPSCSTPPPASSRRVAVYLQTSERHLRPPG